MSLRDTEKKKIILKIINNYLNSYVKCNSLLSVVGLMQAEVKTKYTDMNLSMLNTYIL